MDVDHVDGKSKPNSNLSSVFTLFSELTGDKNENPKYCWTLVKNLRENEFPVGSGSNLKYSVKRLVRGLGSTRLHAQCGCFAALTCVLKYEGCSVDVVLEVLDKEQKPPQGATKSEVRALTAGCVLTCGAIVHSGLFKELSSETQESILKRLIEAGKKRSYLLPVVCQFMVDVIISGDGELFKSVVWPVCKAEAIQNLNESNSDGFYLLLVCLKKNPKMVNKFLQQNSVSPDLLVENILNCLLSSSVKYDHPIFNYLGNFFCMNSTSLIKVWSKCVNENAKMSTHKDTVLITVFHHIIKNLLEATVVPELLIPKFIEIVIKALSLKQTSEMAKKALNSLVGLLSAEGTDETRFQTIKRLIFYPANLKFEIKTGVKCIHSLVSQLSCDFTKKLADVYRQVIYGELKKKIDEEGTEENWNSKEKQYGLHIFTKTLNHPSVKKEIQWKSDQVKFIFEVGFLKKGQFPLEVEKCAKDCFYKAIMMQMPSLKELIVFLDDLADYINGCIKNKELTVDSDIEEFWDKMYNVVVSLKKKLNNKLYTAVHVLLIYMGVHLFVDCELAKGGINELLSCNEHLKETQKKNKEDAPHWTEVTVDLILSLLSRENKLWRHVVSCVFPQIVPQITPSALHEIVDALQNAVLEQESESSEDESGTESESEPEPELESESELSLSEDEGKPNDQLRMAVRNALGYSVAHTDDESIDMDDMNEEEERQLNESLSEAFRQFKSKTKKKKQTKEEEALTHFRLRVLDLIEIYITNSPSMAGCLDLLIPLLDLLEFSIKDHHQRPLRNRVDSILKHISSVKTFSSIEAVTQLIIKDVFRSVVSRKETSSLIFVEMSQRISDCTTFLVRCSQQVPNNTPDIPLVEEYVSLLNSFFQSREIKLSVTMFQSVLRMSWLGNFKIVSSLFDLLVSPNVRIFKKIKIMELLRIFYKNDKLHTSCDDTSKLELNKIEENYISNFIQLLSDKEPKISEKMHMSFFSNVLALLNVIQSSYRKHRGDFDVKSAPPWKNLVEKMAETEVIVSNKKTRCQLGNLANLFKVQLPPTETSPIRKRTLSETSNQVKENENEKKKKKRKMSPEKRKLKNESRILREEMSSDGLDFVRFSKFDAQSLPGHEDEPNELNPVGKKRKKASDLE